MDDNGVCVNFCCVDIEKKTRCLFCEEAPCTKACGKGNPARAIRAIRFDNSKNAGKWLEGCSDADLERAEQACIHYDRPIRIRELLKAVECEPVENNKPLPSLAITFCGIPCENSFFLASSAVCSNYDMVARALEMGWAGVFYKTICKQDIHEVSPRFDAVKEGTAFAGFRNMEQLSENPYEVDFDILRRLKQNYPTKVIVASIMGEFEEDWISFAVSAINTIKSVTLSPEAKVSEKWTVSGYSGRAVKPIALRFILEMAQNPIVNRQHHENEGKLTQSLPACVTRLPKNESIEFSGIGGIETWRDALEFMQLGCHLCRLVCPSGAIGLAKRIGK